MDLAFYSKVTIYTSTPPPSQIVTLLQILSDNKAVKNILFHRACLVFY